MPNKDLFIYLASQSARRKEILEKMKIPFRVIPSRYQEKKIPGLGPRELVIKHALGKARRAHIPKKPGIVLGADTLVYCGRHILGKPHSHKEAFKMLRMLSKRAHWVYTGIALFDPKTQKMMTGVAKTKVIFKKLAEKEILSYLEAVNPFDKAGAYAIQAGPRIVRKINGSYTNVVGLPVELLKKMLKKAHQPVKKVRGNK